VTHAFERVVVQVHVRQFDFALWSESGSTASCGWGSDFDFAGLQLFYGMVAAW